MPGMQRPPAAFLSLATRALRGSPPAPIRWSRKPAQSVEISTDGNQVWAIAERNLLYSADKGATWEAKELSFAAAGNLRLHRLDDTSLFITTNMGLYGSHDAGRNWNRTDIRELSFQSVAGNGNALVVSLKKQGIDGLV